MEFTAVLAWLTLLVGVPLSATAAFLLWKKSREAPHLRVLRERFIGQVVITVVVFFFGVVFVNNDQLIPPMDVDTTKWITRLAILGLAILPAAGWVLIYRSLGRSKGPP